MQTLQMEGENGWSTPRNRPARDETTRVCRYRSDLSGISFKCELMTEPSSSIAEVLNDVPLASWTGGEAQLRRKWRRGEERRVVEPVTLLISHHLGRSRGALREDGTSVRRAHAQMMAMRWELLTACSRKRGVATGGGISTESRRVPKAPYMWQEMYRAV